MRVCVDVCVRACLSVCLSVCLSCLQMHEGAWHAGVGNMPDLPQQGWLPWLKSQRKKGLQVC